MDLQIQALTVAHTRTTTTQLRNALVDLHIWFVAIEANCEFLRLRFSYYYFCQKNRTFEIFLMDREMSFEDDLKMFVHMMAFFMGVKIVTDCFDVSIFDGIFGVSVMLITGIVINKSTVLRLEKLFSDLEA
ncbi:hypothetical protein CEXT_721031 [Caerostris extrusa]|uniref:Uncharacterized protein n=1 Tax=Caerostris extrusa TaxID=172846 RepID=A0AAV4PHB8_CAEEX|nr:hypothetical protein CEXT_721031 [Caerostris extrusa]